MKRQVNDLRLLKLAEMYEISYERFVGEIALGITEDEEIRALLLRLIDPENHTKRIAAELTRLSSELAPGDRAAVVHAAVLDVVDVERAAREFYLKHVDLIHDPDVAALFRDLAAEEANHIAIGERALALAALHVPAHRALNLGDAPEYETLLREGVSDFGSPRRAQKPTHPPPRA